MVPPWGVTAERAVAPCTKLAWDKHQWGVFGFLSTAKPVPFGFILNTVPWPVVPP
jgi:hypothetical protein